MYGFAAGKCYVGVPQFYHLIHLAHQVHFNAIFFLIIKSVVTEKAGIKICTHYIINIV